MEMLAASVDCLTDYLLVCVCVCVCVCVQACFSQVHPCWEHNLKKELGPLIFGAVLPNTNPNTTPAADADAKL
jgi:hypothetical protein